jgi:SulP family sulfate permease
MPRVYSVLPDDNFRHLSLQPHKRPCPQLATLDISGDLYFGAVFHVENAIYEQLAHQPRQRFLLLHLHNVSYIDFDGIQMLESVAQTCRAQGKDVFVTGVREPLLTLMQSSGFHESLGKDHFLVGDEALHYLFHKVLDPAVCIYECDVRAFMECQNLPKQVNLKGSPAPADIPTGSVRTISCPALRLQLQKPGNQSVVIDVRQPREFHRGHIAGARLIPLPELPHRLAELPRNRPVTLVCQSGQRSLQAAYLLKRNRWAKAAFLEGGMLAWKAAELPEVIDY